MTDAGAIDQRLAARLRAMSLRQLRFVVALADSGSFSRAARATGVSQPALSAAIRQVENLLDLRLFDRDTHRVAPTAAGAALLPHARRLLTTADHAFDDMAGAAMRQRATVRVGAIPSAMPAIAEALVALAPRLDRVSVHLSDGKNDALTDELRTGALDLVVGVQSRADAGLAAIALAEDEMLLLVRSDHPHAAAPVLAWSALADCEVVHFSGGSIGELASAAMRQHDLASSARYRVDQVDSLFGLVRAGLAVGVMPRLYTLGLAGGDVTLVPLVEPSIRRRIVLVHRHDLAREHPHAATLAHLLADRLRERLASG